jgi:hypothetical protein
MEILVEGRALVLFDGLDEVNVEREMRTQIIHEVRDFADQFSRSNCVITCRTAASDYQFERFTYCELADFTEDQMQTFVAQWFQRDEAKRAAFLKEFANPEHLWLRDLARTPLLLTLLCLAFAETMMFPLRRVEIYKEALDALLKKWDSSRNIKRDTIYRQLSLSYKHQMLARIAAETFDGGEQFMRQEDLVGRIIAYLQRLPSNDIAENIPGGAILGAIEAQHGLLVERAHGIYSFSHLTFHEYYTARYIVGHPSEQMFHSVIDHAHDVRWREVLLLTASMLDDAEPFFAMFDVMLQKRIQQNRTLIPIIQWIARKAQTTSKRQPRAGLEYLALALSIIGVDLFLQIDRAGIRANAQGGNIGNEIARAHASAYTSARDIAHASARALASPRDIIRALDLARPRARTHLLNFTFDHPEAGDLALDHYLARARACILALSQAVNDTRVQQPQQLTRSDAMWSGFLLRVQVLTSSYSYTSFNEDYNELRTIWHQQTASASRELGAALAQLSLPTERSQLAMWQRFEGDLRAILIAHLDIGHNWMMDTQQLGLLIDYLDASILMLECLDLAAVADRDAIRNRLLLPPQP